MIPAFLADLENKKRKQEHEHDNRVSDQLDLFNDFEIPNIDIGYKIPDDDDDDDTPVLQSKGGGMPQPVDPMKEARAQIAIDEARQAREAAAAEQQRIREQQERQELIARATEKQMQGYNAARSRGQDSLAALGIEDNYGLLDSYYRELDRIKSTIGEDVTNVAPYYTDSVFDNVYNDIEGGTRTRMMNEFQEQYAPGFAENYFGATADDDIINEIISTREMDARANLDRALARGQINETGYNRALAGLNEQRSSANSTLQDLGSNVLTSYRSKLDDFTQGVRDSIGNYTLGSYNPTEGFDERLGSRINEYQGTMRGSILQSLGDSSLFDTSSLLGSAGAFQGVTNTATPAASATTLGQTSPTQLSPDAKKRTQASTGSF